MQSIVLGSNSTVSHHIFIKLSRESICCFNNSVNNALYYIHYSHYYRTFHDQILVVDGKRFAVEKDGVDVSENEVSEAKVKVKSTPGPNLETVKDLVNRMETSIDSVKQNQNYDKASEYKEDPIQCFVNLGVFVFTMKDVQEQEDKETRRIYSMSTGVAIFIRTAHWLNFH